MTPAPTRDLTRSHSVQIARSALRHVTVKPGLLVLEVGARHGDLSLLAARTGADVTAIDVSHLMIERLELEADTEGLHIDTHIMQNDCLDFDDGNFDLVFWPAPATELSDADAFLAEMTRVTKHGGQILVVVPPSQRGDRFRLLFANAGLSEIRVVTDRVRAPATNDGDGSSQLTMAIGTKL